MSLDDILEEAIVKIVESHKSIPVTCSGQTLLKFSEVVSLLKKIESPKRALHVAKWLSVELANVDGKMDGEEGWMDGWMDGLNRQIITCYFT